MRMAHRVTRTTAVACVLLVAACAHGGPFGTASGNERAAQVEADRILSVFEPPSGATRLDAAPGSAPILGADPVGGIPVDPNVVDRAAWWMVSGDAATVLATISADPPAGSVGDQTFDYRDPTQHVFGVEFDWPGVPDVLDMREMQVAVVQEGADTAIRVDAVVTYLPERPAEAHVPPSATALTVRMTARTFDPPTAADRYGPVQVTDPQKVARVAAVIDAAQVPAPGGHSCPLMPADGGGDMTIDFTAGPGSSPVADVEIGLLGCGGISVALPGGEKFDLEGNADQVNQIIDLLGLDWPHQ